MLGNFRAGAFMWMKTFYLKMFNPAAYLNRLSRIPDLIFQFFQPIATVR